MARKKIEKRTKICKVRFTNAEFYDLSTRCPEKMQLASWARTVLLGQAQIFEKQRREPPKADPRLVGELGRIGNNINQIARVVNTYFSEISAACLIDELTAIRAELLTIYNGQVSQSVPSETVENTEENGVFRR